MVYIDLNTLEGLLGSFSSIYACLSVWLSIYVYKLIYHAWWRTQVKNSVTNEQFKHIITLIPL